MLRRNRSFAFFMAKGEGDGGTKGTKGTKGDVTFFGEESNKEPVLWTEKLLVLNWEWPWPPAAPPAPVAGKILRARIGASAIRSLEYSPFGLASPALRPAALSAATGAMVGRDNQAWRVSIVGRCTHQKASP